MTNMTASTAPHSFFSEPLQPTAVLVLEDGTDFMVRASELKKRMLAKYVLTRQ